jgi:hypothetical protein
VDLFSQGLLTHPHPFSFEKEKGDMKTSFFQLFPLSNSIREGELKGVSEN